MAWVNQLSDATCSWFRNQCALAATPEHETLQTNRRQNQKIVMQDDGDELALGSKIRSEDEDE